LFCRDTKFLDEVKTVSENKNENLREDIYEGDELADGRDGQGYEAEKPEGIMGAGDERAADRAEMDGSGHYDQGSAQRKKRQSPMKLIIVGALVFGLAAGAGFRVTSEVMGTVTGLWKPGIESTSTAANGTEQTAEPKLVTKEETDLVSIVDSVSPSIVAITSKVVYQDFMNNPVEQSGAGSGVVYNEDDDYVYILTNNHVIDNSSELIVEFYKGTKAEASLVGSDNISDLAVVKVKKSAIGEEGLKSIKKATFGSSSSLKVGQTAIAIGNPLGIGISVTKGVISALDRQVSESESQKMIQTDAPINPGNSGGALLNSSGEVVGINTVKISETSVEGIGFAIPSDAIGTIVDQLMSKGKVSRPYLGIYGQPLDANTASYYDLPEGVLVASVIDGSGAQKAGLVRGDVITEIDGGRVQTMEGLSQIINGKKVGDKIKVVVYRNGKTVSIQVTLTERTD
jgi:serine protease Do